MGGRGGGAPGNAGRSESSAPAPSAPASLQGQIINAVTGLMAQNRSAWVNIADVRDRIGGSRQEQDAALTALANSRDVIIVPEENQQTLTPRHREGGLQYGGETNHLIRIER